MEIVHDEIELEAYMKEAVRVSKNHPVYIDSFLQNAIELDVDSVCDGEDVLIGGVMEHIEEAGVHSGDSACVIPTQSLSPAILERVKEYTRRIALALGVVGMDSPIKQEDKRKRQARLKRGEILRGELIPHRKDGSSFPAQFTGHAIFDEDGKISGYLAVYRDISAQLQARDKEEQLQRSNQRLNEILASIQDDFYVLNRDWVFVFVSRTFTARVGKEPEDFVGYNIWEMFPKHVGGVLYQNFHIAMEQREVGRFEIPGSYTNAWYRMTAFPSWCTALPLALENRSF